MNFNSNFPIFNDVFESLLKDNKETIFASCTPAINVREDDEKFTLEVAAPGLNKDHFSIQLENNTLTISANLEEEKLTENVKYTRKEFHFKAFKRSFTLPKTADQESIEADYKDGILKIEILKKEEAKPKPIRQIVVA